MIRKMGWLLGVLLLGFWHWGPDYWWSKWAVLLALLSIEIGTRIWERVTPSAGACFTYTCVSSLYIFSWRETYVANLDRLTANSMDSTTAYTLVCFLFLSFFILLAEKSQLNSLRRIFAIAGVADASLVIVQSILHGLKPYGQGGFFDEGPVNGTFMVCTLPFILELNQRTFPLVRILMLGILILGILDTAILDQGSNTFGVLVVVFVSLILFNNIGKFRSLRFKIFSSFFVLLFFTAIFLHLNPNLFSGSGRFEMYRYSFEWLLKQPWQYWLLGMGNGSFFILGPGIQKIFGYLDGGSEWFFWLHSDPLQTFFEMGLIGAALYLWFLVDCFRFAINSRDRNLTATFLGVLSASVFQYPIHVPLFSVFLICVFGMCLVGWRDYRIAS